MTNNVIEPQKITSPIQLLASWLTGLVLVDGAFLTAASTITTPSWASGFLVLAAIVNVPLFLVCLFLLQTKFRTEMQDDIYYSKYLKRESNNNFHNSINLDEHIKKVTAKIVLKIDSYSTDKEEEVAAILRKSEIELLVERFADSRSLSELYLYPYLWWEVVDKWGENKHFQRGVVDLINTGLVSDGDNGISNLRLTSSGEEVASSLQQQRRLWNQRHERRFINE